MEISIRRVLFTIGGDLCLWPERVGRHRGSGERSTERREKERERERGREGQRGAREESERERGRLASQFPAARYIYEAHKVASTTAYIAA